MLSLGRPEPFLLWCILFAAKTATPMLPLPAFPFFPSEGEYCFGQERCECAFTSSRFFPYRFGSSPFPPLPHLRTGDEFFFFWYVSTDGPFFFSRRFPFRPPPTSWKLFIFRGSTLPPPPFCPRSTSPPPSFFPSTHVATGYVCLTLPGPIHAFPFPFPL